MAIKHLSIIKRLDHHGGTVSAHLVQINGFSPVFRKLYLCYTSVYSFVTVLCQVGHIKLSHFVSLFNRLDSHFISRFPACLSPDPQHKKPDPETRLKTSHMQRIKESPRNEIGKIALLGKIFYVYIFIYGIVL